MSGIAGIVDLEGHREINRRALEAMTAALAHRGPDGHGYHYEPGFAFGHRRLALLDRTGGHQPFLSAIGRTVLTFNGQIYNFEALADDLRAKGRPLRTRSDTEVLAEVIDLRGPDALLDLDGMFAFAAYSPRSEEFLLARDRMGEKPLFYSVTQNGYLLFASEIDALLASRRVAETLCGEAVADYLFNGYVPGEGTLYRTVRTLPPGHYLSFRRGEAVPTPRAYWQPCFSPDPQLTLEDASAELWRLLRRAVASRMASDRPVELLLSGGPHSGLLAAALAEGAVRPAATTLRVGDPSPDQSAEAGAMADAARLSHRVVDRPSPASLFRAVGRAGGDPLADPAAFSIYALAEAVAPQAPAALLGLGGDNLFGGRPASRRALRAKWLPDGLRRRLIGPPASRLAEAAAAIPGFRVRQMLDAPFRDSDLYRHAARAIEGAGTDDPFVQAWALELATALPDGRLALADKMAMGHGLDLRAPFLSPALVDFALRLPRALKQDRSGGEPLIRALAANLLPEEIATGDKRAIADPVDPWFSGPDTSLVDALRGGAAWKDSGFFNVDGVLTMADRHQRGRGRFGQELLSVLMFEAFLTKAAEAEEAAAEAPALASTG